MTVLRSGTIYCRFTLCKKMSVKRPGRKGWRRKCEGTLKGYPPFGEKRRRLNNRRKNAWNSENICSPRGGVGGRRLFLSLPPYRDPIRYGIEGGYRVYSLTGNRIVKANRWTLPSPSPWNLTYPCKKAAVPCPWWKLYRNPFGDIFRDSYGEHISVVVSSPYR